MEPRRRMGPRMGMRRRMGMGMGMGMGMMGMEWH